RSRCFKKRKEVGIFLVRKTKYITVDAWGCFRLAPTSVVFLVLISIHHKSILIFNKTSTSESVLKLPARASGFEAQKRVSSASKHNLLCSGEQKIRPAV